MISFPPMPSSFPAIRLQVLTVGLVLFLGSGCARSGRSPEEFIPSAKQAEATLKAALTAWQEGQMDGTIPNAIPTIIISDTMRRPGQRLSQFEILGEAPGDLPRCFAVRLVLAEPREEMTVRYAVFGIDPLHVVRHEDLVMLEHWDHAMMVERARQDQITYKK
jgi:hypothetical protein